MIDSNYLYDFIYRPSALSFTPKRSSAFYRARPERSLPTKPGWGSAQWQCLRRYSLCWQAAQNDHECWSLTDRDFCGSAYCNLLATITLALLQNSTMLMTKNNFNRSIPMPDNASPTGDKNVIVISADSHRLQVS